MRLGFESQSDEVNEAASIRSRTSSRAVEPSSERLGGKYGAIRLFFRRTASRCVFAAAGGALVFLCACVAPEIPDIATHVDPNTHIRTDLIPENFLETDGPVRELLWLNASRVFKDYRSFEYYLEVHYEAKEETGLLKVSPGQSLIVVTDGVELKFNGSGSLNARRQRSGTVSEDAIYVATPNDLRAIAYAERVTVRVYGANGVLTREFKPANSEKFRKFVMLFVEGS